ncbi:hypothetical protein ACFSYD_15470 [Paracoccus aerius]
MLSYPQLAAIRLGYGLSPWPTRPPIRRPWSDLSVRPDRTRAASRWRGIIGPTGSATMI